MRPDPTRSTGPSDLTAQTAQTAPSGAVRRRLVAVAVLAGVLLAGCGGGGSTTDAGNGGAATSTPTLVGLQRQDPPRVGDLTLTDARSGETFGLTPAPGDLELVYFGYTSCPDVCPTTLSDLRKALRTLGPDAARIGLTFVSIDPGRDTAAVLDGFVGSFVANNHVVRIEDPEALAAVKAPFGATSSVGPVQDDGTYEVKHSGTMYVVDPSGRVVLEWAFGTPFDAEASDLRLLLDRAAGTATVPGTASAPATTAQEG